MTPQQRKVIQEIFQAILEEEINPNQETTTGLDPFQNIQDKTLEALKVKGIIESYDRHDLGVAIEFIPRTIAQYAEWSR